MSCLYGMKRRRKCKPTTTDTETGEKITLPDDRTLWCNSLREAGSTIDEIAKTVGIGKSTVIEEVKLYRDTVARGSGGVEAWQKDADVVIPLALRAVIKNLKKGDGRLGAEILRGRGVLTADLNLRANISTANPAEQLIEGLATLLQVPEYRRQIVAMIADSDSIPAISEHNQLPDTPVSAPSEPSQVVDMNKQDKVSYMGKEYARRMRAFGVEPEDDDTPVEEGKHALSPDPPHTPEDSGT